MAIVRNYTIRWKSLYIEIEGREGGRRGRRKERRKEKKEIKRREKLEGEDSPIH